MKATVATGGQNNPTVQNVRGWNARGDAIVRLRSELVTGDILAAFAAPSVVHLNGDILAADGGCYVEVVSGTLAELILWH